jgi:hypothetical protein
MFNPHSESFVLNRQAQQCFSSDFSQFLSFCKTCVDQSQNLKVNNHPASLIKFSQHVPAHDKIIEKIKETCSSSPPPGQEDGGVASDMFDNKEAIKNWFFQNFNSIVRQDASCE